jgi:hypothetical protein
VESKTESGKARGEHCLNIFVSYELKSRLGYRPGGAAHRHPYDGRTITGGRNHGQGVHSVVQKAAAGEIVEGNLAQNKATLRLKRRMAADFKRSPKLRYNSSYGQAGGSGPLPLR